MGEFEDAMKEMARKVLEAPEAPMRKLHDDSCGVCQGTGWTRDGRCPACGGLGRDFSKKA